MICPICHRRRPSRFCPARQEAICPVCCATEREVTIDCPSECEYLRASRQHDADRREIDWSQIPFPEVKVPPSALADHLELLSALTRTVCAFALANRSLVDTDAIAALQALAEGYRTLAAGIYYEKPPDYRLQRELYDALKSAINNYRREEAGQAGIGTVRDSTVRDALIAMAQLGATRTNGRPKGRAFLDFLRARFAPGMPTETPKSIVLLS